MSLKSAFLERGTLVDAQRPWARIIVDADEWRRAIYAVADGNVGMFGLWCDGEAVHMGLAEAATGELLVVSLLVSRPPLSLGRPLARTRAASRARHRRPLRADRGRYPGHAPLARSRPVGRQTSAGRALTGAGEGLGYTFLPAEGPPLHQIPVGPVHAGIIEPGHFRFSAMARRWCGWRSASATSTRAFNR